MALDARITKVKPHREGLELSIAPSDPDGEIVALTELIIMNPTHTPRVGDTLRVDTETILLQSGGTDFIYHRLSTRRLIEDWSTPAHLRKRVYRA